MGSSGGGVGDEPQYVVAKYDYIAQGNQVRLEFDTPDIFTLNSYKKRKKH